jgi:hypothetical protein
MREKIVSATFFDYKAVSLGVVEPLDLALRHDELPCSVIVGHLLFVLLFDGSGLRRFGAPDPYRKDTKAPGYRLVTPFNNILHWFFADGQYSFRSK